MKELRSVNSLSSIYNLLVLIPASSVQYVDPLLINIKPWYLTNLAIYDTFESKENEEILYYHVGRGNRYSICLHCGRAATEAGNLIVNYLQCLEKEALIFKQAFQQRKEACFSH